MAHRLRLTCPKCGARLALAEPALDRSARCPKCGGLFRARRRDPGADAPAATVPVELNEPPAVVDAGDSLVAESQSSWAGGTVMLDENGVADLLAEISRKRLKPIHAARWKLPAGSEPVPFTVKILFADVAAARRALDALLPVFRAKAKKIIAASRLEGRNVAVLELGLRLPPRQAADALRGVIASGGRLLGVDADDSFDAERLLVLVADPGTTDPAELVDPGLSDSDERPAKA